MPALDHVAIETFSARLRHELAHTALRESRIADSANMPVKRLHRLALGQLTSGPTLGEVKLLAEVFRVSPAWLAGWSEVRNG